MLINPSRDIVVSLACYSCSMSVRLEGFNGDFLLKFLEFKYERNQVHFSPYEFFLLHVYRAIIFTAFDHATKILRWLTMVK